jgi:hypothetical protein
MVFVTANWRMWLVGMAASLAIFAVVYFTGIQPDQNTANQVLKSGLQQAINHAQKQLSTASGQVSSAGGQAASSAASQAEQQLSVASQLTACVSAAGTDVAKVQACDAKYGK